MKDKNKQPELLFELEVVISTTGRYLALNQQQGSRSLRRISRKLPPCGRDRPQNDCLIRGSQIISLVFFIFAVHPVIMPIELDTYDLVLVFPKVIRANR